MLKINSKRGYADKNIKETPLSDVFYPKNLKNIYDPPDPLYVKGRIVPGDDIAVAIVGSRKASLYGLKTCEKLAYELAGMGVTIVSGLARGIDSAAHRGALKAGGRTIAVFGCGLDYIYPSENKKLAEEIEQNGALVSEFPAGAMPLPYNFPKRNRIISGLSLGVVVVEASKDSGALITADFALEQGREVFAVPGKIDASTSTGTHRLIKEGAKLVEGADDILEELNLKSTVQSSPMPNAGIDEYEQKIYSILSDEPKYIDEITKEANLVSSEVCDILLRLQLKKLIKELPGKRYFK